MIVKSKQDYLKEYKVDEVLYISDMERYLKDTKPSTIYLYDGVNTDSDLKAAVPTFSFL